MGNICSYFVKNQKNLIPEPRCIFTGDKYRISIITPRLVRIEYNKDNQFEDRATSLVINRNFVKTNFTVEQDEISLNIKTEYFNLIYLKSQPIANNNIKVIIQGDINKEWTPGNKEIRNIGGLSYSLDDLDKNLKLEKGLYSLDGFVTIDDSKNYVIEKDSFIKREETTDLYLFVYGTDLGLCLQDYFNLTGYPDLIPRYALGAWWYKNDRYNMYDIDNIIKKFNDNHIPISVFLLGNKWHKYALHSYPLHQSFSK